MFTADGGDCLDPDGDVEGFVVLLESADVFVEALADADDIVHPLGQPPLAPPPRSKPNSVAAGGPGCSWWQDTDLSQHRLTRTAQFAMYLAGVCRKTRAAKPRA